MENIKNNYSLLNISCKACGAPSYYDIEKQTYVCSYCGAWTSQKDALVNKKGYRKIFEERLNSSKEEFPAVVCTCTGCGAEILFSENEVLTKCSFCNRQLVRKDYLDTADMPELIIPFEITKEEAKTLLTEYCAETKHKREARHIMENIKNLKAFYLPYEVIKGPVKGDVYREGCSRHYECGSFIEGMLINTTRDIDNRVLDGMEPYDLSKIREFDFSYIAGHRAKINDISDEQLDVRIKEEVEDHYRVTVNKTMETSHLSIFTDNSELMKIPALVPVYYVYAGKTCAAINGQTGKISLKCEKAPFRGFPWWIKPIIGTLLAFAASYAACLAFGADHDGAMYVSGGATLVLGLIIWTMFHNAYEGSYRPFKPNRIFSSDRLYERENGSLVELNRNIEIAEEPPMFFEKVNGRKRKVNIEFSSFGRVSKNVILAILIMLAPVIVTYILNGFSAEGVTLIGGSSVWFLITVPTVPVICYKITRIDIYDYPKMYTIDSSGRKTYIRKKITKEEINGYSGVAVIFIIVLAIIVLVNMFWYRV